MNENMEETMSENDWVNKFFIEGMNEQMNEWINEQMNEWMNERMNEYVNADNIVLMLILCSLKEIKVFWYTYTFFAIASENNQW